MKEKRRSQRVRFDAKCSLTHSNIIYLGQVVNISLNGALISFNDGLVIPSGERCTLAIYLNGEETQFRAEVEVVHSNFTMIGIKFNILDHSARELLDKKIKDHIAKNDCSRIEPRNGRFRELEG
jgi:hypothetical protein